MTPLEMIEMLAGFGYKSCWYARVQGGHGDAVPHIRVTSVPEGGFLYHVNEKEGTREEAEALLAANIPLKT